MGKKGLRGKRKEWQKDMPFFFYFFIPSCYFYLPDVTIYNSMRRETK